MKSRRCYCLFERIMKAKKWITSLIITCLHLEFRYYRILPIKDIILVFFSFSRSLFFVFFSRFYECFFPFFLFFCLLDSLNQFLEHTLITVQFSGCSLLYDRIPNEMLPANETEGNL